MDVEIPSLSQNHIPAAFNHELLSSSSIHFRPDWHSLQVIIIHFHHQLNLTVTSPHCPMLSIPFPSLPYIITHEFHPFTTIQSNPYPALPFHIPFTLCHSIPFAKPYPNKYLSQMPIMLFSLQLILSTYSIMQPSPTHSDPFHLHQLI